MLEDNSAIQMKRVLLLEFNKLRSTLWERQGIYYIIPLVDGASQQQELRNLLKNYPRYKDKKKF
jgi:hypothetical protein